MPTARRLLAQRYVAMLVVASALFLKLLVPAGYMIDTRGGHVALTICSGVASEPMAMDMPGMHGDPAGHGKKDHGKTELPCPFSGLAAAALGAIDPIQLAALIAFIMAVATRGIATPAIHRRAHLRPPLRGPPLTL